MNKKLLFLVTFTSLPFAAFPAYNTGKMHNATLKKETENIKKLHEFDSEVRNELKQKRDVMVRDILKQIDEVVSEYGKSEGFDLILNDRVLLYRVEELDVTDEIINRLNKKHQ